MCTIWGPLKNDDEMMTRLSYEFICSISKEEMHRSSTRSIERQAGAYIPSSLPSNIKLTAPGVALNRARLRGIIAPIISASMLDLPR